MLLTIERSTSGPLNDAAMMKITNAPTGNAISQPGGRTPFDRSSSVVQLRCERRSSTPPATRISSGPSQTNGDVHTNSVMPCHIGRTSHSATSAMTASAI